MKIEKMDIILDRDNKEEYPPVKFEFVKQLKNRENRRLPRQTQTRVITERRFKLPKWSTVKAFLLTVCIPLYVIFGVFYTGKLSFYLGLEISPSPSIMAQWLNGLLVTMLLAISIFLGVLFFSVLKALFEDLKDRFEE